MKVDDIKILLVLYIIIISFILLYDIIFYYFTKFEKIVTVKSKYLSRNEGKRDRYMMSDVENNIYHVQNRPLSWEFNEAENWNSIIIGKTYKISGYKKRIRLLDMYPIIIEIIPIE
tara:strand:+ start:5772 stop:6119 length:348 start_codon:yes stop_codon:yes gene_type:complete